MAEADPSPLDGLLAEFRSLDKTYEIWCTFYKHMEDILGDDHVDKLTLAILQQYKLGNQQTPISTQINHKSKQLKSTREALRIGVIGDVAAGKSSLINYIMGVDFLPVDQGICTKVICEICNSDFRNVIVSFDNDTTQKTLLEMDPAGQNWQWLRDVIENGYVDCQMAGKRIKVIRIEIFYPLHIFQDILVLKPHESDAVSIQFFLISTSDNNLDCSEIDNITAPMTITRPPVVFMDFPGLDDTTDKDGNNISIVPVIEAIENNHVDGLLFVIDNSLHSGVNESTVKMLMYQITTMFPEFDTDLCLFLCNKWDLVSKRKHKRTELMQTITSKLQEPWPTVRQDQIIQFSCKEQNDEDIFINSVYRYIKIVRRRKLEEYWLWLTNLCETANVIMRNRRKWCKTADTLQEIKHKAKNDVQSLKLVKEELISKGGDILETKVTPYKQKYKDFLKERLSKYCSTKQLNENEDSFTTDLHEARRDFSLELQPFKEEIDTWFQTLQNNSTSKSWLLQLFNKTSIKSSYKYGFLKYGLLIVFPVAKLVLVGRFIQEEIQEVKLNNANIRIELEVNHLSYYVKELQQNFIRQLERQMTLLSNIDDLEIQPCSEQTINRVQTVMNGLLTVFIKDVCTHEIERENVKIIGEIDKSRHVIHAVDCHGIGELARKTIHTKIKQKYSLDDELRESTTESIEKKVLYCKELMLLRKLSKLNREPDDQHFVKYYGSCVMDEKQFVTLYIFMEKCDRNLADYCQEQTLNVVTKIDVCMGATKGVGFLHRNNIVHCDIKPQHFLVTHGIVKICDVGHSKEEDNIVTGGQSLGTKQSHPPEISQYNPLHTKKSDIYSLGLVFRHIWEDSTFAERQTQAPPKEIDKSMKKIIMDCSAEDPKRRPDITTILEQLESMKQMLEITRMPLENKNV